jgi:hypothetical protein
MRTSKIAAWSRKKKKEGLGGLAHQPAHILPLFPSLMSGMASVVTNKVTASTLNKIAWC